MRRVMLLQIGPGVTGYRTESAQFTNAQNTLTRDCKREFCKSAWSQAMYDQSISRDLRFRMVA